MRTLICFLLLTSILPAHALERRWISKDINVKAGKAVELQIKQSANADGCNEVTLSGSFKPVVYKNEAYLIADFTPTQTEIACKKTSDGPPTIEDKELQTEKYVWNLPKNATSAFVLIPENSEIVFKQTRAQ